MKNCLFCERSLKGIKKNYKFNHNRYCSVDCKDSYNKDKGLSNKTKIPRYNKYKYCKKCKKKIGLIGTPKRICNSCKKKPYWDLKNMTSF